MFKGIFQDIAGKYKHPGYSEETFDNNVALLRTKDKIEKTQYVEPIQLQMIEIKENIPLVAMGFGYTEKERNVQNELRWARFISLSDADCKVRTASTNHQILYNKKILCVEGYLGYNQAWGPYDLGGALVLQDTLVGILNYPCFGSVDCTSAPLLAYRVQPYIPWILDTMIKHEC